MKYKMYRSMLKSTAFVAVAALAFGSGCASTQSDRASTCAQLNQFTSSQQAHVTLAADGRDGMLVAWDSRRQQQGRYGVYGRFTDLSGRPLGDEFAINQHVKGHQKQPSVASDPTGGYWVAWTSTGQDGQAGGIVARQFKHNQWRPEVAINEHRSGHQEQPAIAVNHDGHAIMAWLTETPDGYQVAFRGVGVDGKPVGRERHIDSPGTAALPRLATLPDGRFILLWQISTDRPAGLMMQIVDSDGQAAGPMRTIACEGSVEASVDALSDGAIIAWLTPGEAHYSVFTQRIDAEGRLLGEPEEIEATRESDAWISGVHVAAHADDSWTLVWNEDTSGKGEHRIRMQQFSSDGQPKSSAEWLDGDLDPGHHVAIAATTPAFIVSSSGSRVVGFSGHGPGDDSSAANVMVLDPVVIEKDGVSSPPAPARMVAMAPTPPTFDPDFMPLDPMPRRAGAVDYDFEGISNTGWNPPDPDIAVGPDHVVEVVNGGIAAYTLDGTQLFQEPIEGSSGFWGSVGAPGFVFDPEVVWDPHARRFVAMANARNGADSYFLLAVSATDQADGVWYKYLLDVSDFDSSIDSPNLSVDDRFIYVSADFFSPDKYLILCIKKDPALVGDPLTWKQLSLSGAGNQSLGMPVTWDPQTPQYLIQSSEGTGNGVGFNEIRIHAIANPDLDPTLQTYDLPVQAYSYPTQPPQQGTTDRPFLFEPRFWSCIQRGGSIWAVHHVNNDRTRVRWYEIAMNGWPTSSVNPSVAQWGEIDAGQGIHTYFPGITVDGLGNAAVTFARSSANEYISMYRAKRAVGDPLGTFQPMKLVKESSAPMTGGRWGDYAGVAPYPDEQRRLWLAHEWTNGGGWRTWITEVVFPQLCEADVNGDNVVDVADILLVIANYGSCSSCIEDMDDDGFVGIYEILTILDSWGPC